MPTEAEDIEMIEEELEPVSQMLEQVDTDVKEVEVEVEGKAKGRGREKEKVKAKAKDKKGGTHAEEVKSERAKDEPEPEANVKVRGTLYHRSAPLLTVRHQLLQGSPKIRREIPGGPARTLYDAPPVSHYIEALPAPEESKDKYADAVRAACTERSLALTCSFSCLCPSAASNVASTRNTASPLSALR